MASVVVSGTTVQPVCLPHGADKFEPEMLYGTSGWQKTSESKRHQKSIILF
jgi:hypothetical protein